MSIVNKGAERRIFVNGIQKRGKQWNDHKDKMGNERIIKVSKGHKPEAVELQETLKKPFEK